MTISTSQDQSREEVIEHAQEVISPATRIAFPEVVLAGGAGARIWEDDGKEIIDLHSMASAMNVGYHHPRLAAVVAEHAKNFVHVNPAYVIHPASVRLARKLTALLPGGVPRQVSFGHSGSDGVDGAIKLARAHTGRERIITFRQAYHGNTYGALSVSSASEAMIRGFEPVVPAVSQVDFPLVSALAEARASERGERDERMPISASAQEIEAEIERIMVEEGDVAAIIIEPIQGDSGVWIPPAGFLDRLKALTVQHGALLIADEVQTGLGRTGRMFASEVMEEFPDILVLGKALGGGLPMSAIIASKEIMASWAAPGHVFSGASNPLICDVAATVLDIIEDEGLVARSQELGNHMRATLVDMMARVPEIIDVRGSGLMIGVQVDLDTDSGRLLPAKVLKYCLDNGVYLTFLAGSVLRIIPPLTITRDDLDTAAAVIERAFIAARNNEITDEEVAAFAGW